MKLLWWLAALSQAQSNKWIVSSIATVDATVSNTTDLKWALQSNQPVLPQDCIQFSITNPYQEPFNFFANKGPITCDQQCTILSPSVFQITFNSSAPSTLVQGRSYGNIFTNPYSAKRISQVQITHLQQCKTPVVTGTSSFPQFIPQLLNQTTIKSSSQKIGQTQVNFTVQFNTTSDLLMQGKIIIQSPYWYQSQQVGQEGVTQDFYSDTLISFDSNALITPLSVQSISFSEQSLVIVYTASRVYTSGTPVSITLTNCQNPVDSKLVTGFQISTTDKDGFLIDQSGSLSLSTIVNEAVPLNFAQITLLGDQSGLNAGMIGTLQKVQIQVSTLQPLEPFCYFQFKFPASLQLTGVQYIEGSGIFQPYYDNNVLNTGQYSVDLQNNVLSIEGCRLPDSLSQNPYGTIQLSYLKMPNYVQDIPAIQILVYTDQVLTNLVINDPASAKISALNLSPGLIIAELFKPSNFYASATNVAYSIFVRPQHDLTPDSRIIISMPDLLQFNRSEGCQAVLTVCSCTIDEKSNILTLTNILQSNLAGGNLIKFVILKAQNPKGSRQAGPWSIRSETKVNGTYYTVDGQTYPESFFALSGAIYSNLQISNLTVSSSQTVYNFTITVQHDVPEGGSLTITFPAETTIKNNKVVGIQNYTNQGNTYTFYTSLAADTPFVFQVLGVQNVRSMQPSSSFYLATADQQGFVIDSGGQDIVIEPTSFAYIDHVAITTLNQTNGGVGAWEVTMNMTYPIMYGDVLHLDLPQEMHFINPVCTADFPISCSYSGQSFQATYLNTQDATRIRFTITGVQNPPSFRPTSPLATFFTTDQAGYKSQAIRTPITFQTTQLAYVQQFSLAQQTEDYNKEGSIQLQFVTVNQIPPTGAIVLKWPSTVSMFQNTYCQITTYKQILLNVCKFDYESQTLTIQNAFVGMTSQFSGQITIFLSRVLNPMSNQQQLSYNVTTFQDSSLQYPADTFAFQPLLKCFWSCQLCSTDKNYCTQCWPQMKLFQFQSQSTCLDQCPVGWTSNGTVPAVCQQCDISCGSCLDQGQGGDIGRCLTCKPGFNLFQPTSANAGLCLQRCQQGFFDNSNGLCLPCDSSCQSCAGSADACTSCNQDSAIPALLGRKCVGECPSYAIDIGGVCQKCNSPCAQCEGTQAQCTDCDGTNGRIFRFGFDCVSQCPTGTKLNMTSNECTGCMSGCAICDLDNPTICYSCSPGYLRYQNGCYASCPAETMLNFAGTSCRAMSSLDVRLIYFPFLILTVLVAFVSWIGHKIKPTHLVFANIAIMLGAVEHLALIVQLALSFIQGTYAVAIPIVIIYILFVVSLVGFSYFWRRDVILQDARYQQYANNLANQRSTTIRTVLGSTVSWKFYKLLYSHFFGIKITSFRFSEPVKVEQLMFRTTLANIVVTYLPLIVLNFIGLAYMTWGTQLYIMMIENLILALIGIFLGGFEHRQMCRDRKNLDKVQQTAGGLGIQIRKNGLKLNAFKAGFIVNKERFSFLFIDSKVNELVKVFGVRRCKSDFNDSPDQQQDERLTLSWPTTPTREVIVQDPPQPLAGFMNCYHEPKEGWELKPLKGQGFNKACQKGGPFDNDLLRADTAFMSDQVDQLVDLGSASKSGKKQRGRRNRYLKQIEKEDYKNTGLPHEYLDSVSEESIKHVEDQDTIDNSMKKLKETVVTQQSAKSARNVKASLAKQINAPNVRNFNEIDILGEFDRDDSGQVIVLQDSDGNYIDKKSRSVTMQGYLVDADGDIVSAHDPTVKMFKGLLPAPFQFEKYNFNPYEMIGNFKSYRQNNDPTSFMKTSDKGGTMDSKHRYVNQQGFLIRNGNLIDQRGNTVFDSKQLDKGRLPPLLNYQGQQFQILDVMGVFKLNDFNEVIIAQKDLSGHLVNSKGYLVNNTGDIVNRKNKVIFKANELKFGDFPKIFPFSKLNIQEIQGTFEMENGHPVLTRKQDGTYSDDNGIKVNAQGFLIDSHNNIVDHNGNIVIEAHINSNLQVLFKLQKADETVITEKSVFRRHSRRDSSYGSEMGVSPAQYDLQNGHKEDNPLRASTVVSKLSESSSVPRTNKKKKGIKLVRVEQMFLADVKMARAYGGEAQPRVRMVPKRFQTTHRERPFQETMRDSEYSQQVAVSTKLQPKMFANEYATTSNNGFKRSHLEAAGATQLGLRRPSSPSNQAFSIKNPMQIRKQQQKFREDIDDELAELYKQDVDKFIDGSNFEVESLSGFSDLSGVSIVSRHQQERDKARQLEQEYLQKLEQQKLQFQQQTTFKR